MAGKTCVRQLEQPLQGVEEALGSLLRADGEVGPGRVSDEERAREHEPRFLGARAVDHANAGVLRPVAGRVHRAQDDLAELELVSVGERLVLVRRLGRRVDGDQDAVVEREPAGRRGGRRACASRPSGRSRPLARRLPRGCGSIAYGGSTTAAATPASSSPIRYDAQPRSSSELLEQHEP